MAILAQHDSTYEVHSMLTDAEVLLLLKIPLTPQVEGLDPANNTDGETLDH